MPNNISNIGFGDYSADQRDIERRRMMAQKLQEQSMQPLETQMAGGWAIPISPTQGLAKMLQAYTGSKGMDKAREDERALGQRYRTERQQELARALALGESTPAQPERTVGDPLLEGEMFLPAQEAKQGDRAAMVRALAGSQFPDLQSVGMTDLLKYREPIKEDAGSVINYRDPNTMQIVASVPKSATPDAQLRSTTTIQTHAAPSGSAILTNQGAMERHATPSGGAILGAQTAIRGQDVSSATARRGQDIGASTAIRGQDIGASTARRGQDMGINPEIQEAVARARAYGKDIGEAQAGLVVVPVQAAEGAKKILSSVNYNDKTKQDDISNLIKRSTSGLLQNSLAQGYGAVTGDATTGRQAIGQLATEANKIAMDMLNGKIGAGISNADRDFIVGQLGDVANANTPSPERAAAWERAMGRIKMLAGVGNPNGAPTLNPPRRRASDAGGTMNFDAQGNLIP